VPAGGLDELEPPRADGAGHVVVVGSQCLCEDAEACVFWLSW